MEKKKASGVMTEVVKKEKTKRKSSLPATSAKTGPAPLAPADKEDSLLRVQLISTVSRQLAKTAGMIGQLMNDAVALYRNIDPQDPFESIQTRLLVGVTNSSMDCFSTAMECDPTSRARDLNLRHAMRGTAIASDLIQTLKRNRGQGRRNVMVGNVKVEAGGQAIVSNVDTGEQRKQTTKPQSVLRSASKKSGD